MKLKYLIKKCWDANPKNRPTAREIVKISRDWQIEIGNENGEFYQQYKDCEEFNKTLSDEVRYPKYEIHSYNTYTSKAINTSQITELLTKSKPTNAMTENFDNTQDFTKLNIEAIQTEQESPLQSQQEQSPSCLESKVEIPPKKGL